MIKGTCSKGVNILVFMSNYLHLFLCPSKLKTKMYLALQSLELDLTKMMHMFR